ncbi:MAG TPA: SRPBCC family protein [Phycisphaerales bacterium]|nr:SRPBCC family protein [Phycisphaerales bacterium]
MTLPVHYQPVTPIIDNKLDLLLERTIATPPAAVWAAWTKPHLLMKWFTPSPWKTVECEIDLRPGGIFRTVMESPEGERFPGTGCYLEVVPQRRLVWTNVLLPGFRPVAQATRVLAKPCDEFLFTAIITIEPHATGTRYSALAIHTDPQARDRHESMGFENGWGTALKQLEDLMRTESY